MDNIIFSDLGMAQAAPDVWTGAYTHPVSGGTLSVRARVEPDGPITVRYAKDGRFHKEKTYLLPGRAGQSIRQAVRRGGYGVATNSQ